MRSASTTCCHSAHIKTGSAIIDSVCVRVWGLELLFLDTEGYTHSDFYSLQIMGYQEIKLEWPEVPRLKLKLLFLTHLILISWSSLGQWAEQAVLIHNLMFLFTFVWCIIQHDNEDSIFLCFAINTISILLDVIILSSRYPTRLVLLSY